MKRSLKKAANFVFHFLLGFKLPLVFYFSFGLAVLKKVSGFLSGEVRAFQRWLVIQARQTRSMEIGYQCSILKLFRCPNHSSRDTQFPAPMSFL